MRYIYIAPQIYNSDVYDMALGKAYVEHGIYNMEKYKYSIDTMLY